MEWYYYLIIGVVIALVILAGFIVVFLAKQKKSKILVNDSFISALTTYLGSKNNILKVEVEQGRIKITVTDLNLVDLEKLKTLTDKGIFVTGNVIKALFKDDANLIKEALEKR